VLRYNCAVAYERSAGISEAASAVKRGALVVLPTDTVYGLGCDAFNPPAVEALLAAKRRERDMPVPVLIGSWHTLDGLVDHVPAYVHDLVRAFWPGGVTLVVRHAPSLAWDLGDAFGTVAVRMPLHAVAVELLQLTGPMAVSSANISGQVPATTCDNAQMQLGGDVAVYLDGGQSAQAVPSSIVDCTGTRPRLLRAGALTADEIRDVVPDLTD
jgi:L-threonylcarbamoyladenylate synthase